MIPHDDAALESFVITTAEAIDLPIAVDERPAVVAAARGLALQAAIVMAFVLPIVAPSIEPMAGVER